MIPRTPRLEVGEHVRVAGKPYTVCMVNDCRAELVPEFKIHRVIKGREFDRTPTTRDRINVSPYSEVERI